MEAVPGLYEVDLDSPDELDKYLKYGGGQQSLDLDSNHNYQAPSQYYYPQVTVHYTTVKLLLFFYSICAY